MAASILYNTVHFARHLLNIYRGLRYFGQKLCRIMKHVLHPICFSVKLIFEMFIRKP